MLEIEKLIAPSTRVTFNVKGEMKIDGMGMITPMRIAKDMVNIIPDKEFNKDTKFLDIACKSGNFLRCIHDRLMTSESMIKAFPNDRERHFYIINNQLYGVALQQQDVMIATRNVYGQLVKDSHIVYIPSYIDRYISCRDIKGLQDKLKELTGQMKFDVIIGNPPYNNDMYLDFITVAKNLIDKQEGNGQVCMITPAKWQAKGGNKNEDFRENIVPYMDKIVYYPEAKEVFDIGEWDGITYFSIDKNKIHNTKSIQNICKSNNALDSSMEQTDEVSVTLYRKSIRDILRKIDYSKNMQDKCRVIYSEFVGNTYWGNKEKRAENDLELYQGEKHIGYVSRSELRTDVNVDKYKVITSVMAGAGIYSMDKNGKALGSNKLNKLRPNQVPKGSYTCLAFFDSSEECDSYMSYFETKLVSFLVYIGVCGTSFAKEFWRYIPQPKAFDHIFTDKELYEKYDLTEEEINIIESVIKDRK